MRIAIIDYEVGNIRSVANAFDAIKFPAFLSNDPNDLASADALILPGVGSFADGMNNLKRLGLVDLLTDLVLRQKRPILGFCLGMQLLAEVGFEDGQHQGLGWIKAQAVRFKLDNAKLKVPHIGWNDVRSRRDNPLLGAAGAVSSFYFVHSYYLECADEQDVIGSCDYGLDFAAVLQRENIFATQFHPEKSQKNGLNLLCGFVQYAAEQKKLAHA